MHKTVQTTCFTKVFYVTAFRFVHLVLQGAGHQPFKSSIVDLFRQLSIASRSFLGVFFVEAESLYPSFLYYSWCIFLRPMQLESLDYQIPQS